jgi:hypothetical protein
MMVVSDETGEVPGFASVASAMGTPSARIRSIGGLRVSRKK